MKLIERTDYLNRLIDLKGTPDIKIITGIRRCGKSQLMAAYLEHIKRTDDKANIISVDFMDLEFEELKEYHALHNYIKARYDANKNNYVFIDEVQRDSFFTKNRPVPDLFSIFYRTSAHASCYL
ncbi:MAG: AAA family ATPase [Clostridia bacterium]|nr:AAA family ATPase [Clostridia bacterium]